MRTRSRARARRSVLQACWMSFITSLSKASSRPTSVSEVRSSPRPSRMMSRSSVSRANLRRVNNVVREECTLTYCSSETPSSESIFLKGKRIGNSWIRGLGKTCFSYWQPNLESMMATTYHSTYAHIPRRNMMGQQHVQAKYNPCKDAGSRYLRSESVCVLRILKLLGDPMIYNLKHILISFTRLASFILLLHLESTIR